MGQARRVFCLAHNFEPCPTFSPGSLVIILLDFCQGGSASDLWRLSTHLFQRCPYPSAGSQLILSPPSSFARHLRCPQTIHYFLLPPEKLTAASSSCHSRQAVCFYQCCSTGQTRAFYTVPFHSQTASVTLRKHMEC